MEAGKRKSSAYAICTASANKNCDAADIIANLPPYIDIEVDDNGYITLGEVEGYDFSEYDEKLLASEDVDCESPCSSETDASGIFRFNSSYVLAAKKGDDEEDALCNIEMLRAGKFKHPWLSNTDDGFLSIDRKMFLNIIQNYLNDILHREVPLDLEHRSDEGSYGWLRKVSISRRKFNTGKIKDVLNGGWELTEEGKKLIDGKKYKYFSIEFAFDHKDKETEKSYGTTMNGGGLTNRPFIPGMKAVVLSEDFSNVDHGKPAVEDEQSAKTTGGSIEGFSGVCNSDAENSNKEVKAETEQKLAQGDKPRPTDSKLPNAAFALIKRDSSGKIIKRSLPHHGPSVKNPSENSSIDLGRLRNALARINQVDGFTTSEISRAKSHLETHARALLPSKKDGKASDNEREEIMDPITKKIAELQDQLDAFEDQKSEAALKLMGEIKYLNDLKGNVEETAKKQEATFSEQMKERDAKLTEYAENQKKLAAQLANMAEKNRQLEVSKFYDLLIAENHAPAVAKAARDVLMGEIQKNGDVVTKFNETIDGKTVEHSCDLRSALTHVLASIPKAGKVDKTTEIKTEAPNAPLTDPSANGKVKVSDGEVDLNDDAAIQRRVKKAGYKTVKEVQ